MTVIINFLVTEPLAGHLKQRVEGKMPGREVTVINLTTNELQNGVSAEKRSALKKIQECHEVYVIDHGSPNSTRTAASHYQELAELMAPHIPKDRAKGSEVKISLIVCYGGVGPNFGFRSFAGLFHRYLGQQLKIPVEVLARKQIVMVNSQTLIRGKTTTTSVELPFVTSLYHLLESGPNKAIESLMRHEEPGTKISLSWDPSGNELLIDAYIKKYFSNVERVVTCIQELKIEDDEKANSRLGQICLELQKITEKWSNKNYIAVKKMDCFLVEMEQILRTIDNDKTPEIVALIEKNIHLSRDSISNKSVSPLRSKIKIDKPPVEKERAIKPWIQKKIVLPVMSRVEELPKSDVRTEFQQSCVQYLQQLAGYAAFRLNDERDADLEITISEFLQSIMMYIVDDKMSLSDKIEAIVDTKKMIENEMKEFMADSGQEGPHATVEEEGESAISADREEVTHSATVDAIGVNVIKHGLDMFIDAALVYLCDSSRES